MVEGCLMLVSQKAPFALLLGSMTAGTSGFVAMKKSHSCRLPNWCRAIMVEPLGSLTGR